MPHESVLEPFHFALYINNIDQNVYNSNFHYYADDTVISSSASTPNLALSQLQLAFNIVQHNLYELKPVLNSEITACFLIQNQSLIIFSVLWLSLCLSIGIGMILFPLSLMFGNWSKYWKWNWDFIVESAHIRHFRIYTRQWCCHTVYMHPSSQCLQGIMVHWDL